jgi:hypothetical protein
MSIELCAVCYMATDTAMLARAQDRRVSIPAALGL